MASMLSVAIVTTGYAGWMDSVSDAFESSKVDNPLTAPEIDKALGTVKLAGKYLSESSASIVNIMGDSKTKAELKAKIAEAEKISDPKEKEAALAKTYEDSVAATVKYAKSSAGKKQITTLTENQKKEAANGIFKFALAGKLDAEAVKMSESIASKAKNDPTNAARYATKLDEVKSIPSSATSQISTIADISTGLFDVASESNIAVPALDASTVEEVMKAEDLM